MLPSRSREKCQSADSRFADFTEISSATPNLPIPIASSTFITMTHKQSSDSWVHPALEGGRENDCNLRDLTKIQQRKDLVEMKKEKKKRQPLKSCSPAQKWNSTGAPSSSHTHTRSAPARLFQRCCGRCKWGLQINHLSFRGDNNDNRDESTQSPQSFTSVLGFR